MSYDYWAHAPIHKLNEKGIYMVTCGTFHKKHFFHTPERLNLMHSFFFEMCDKYQWSPQAWAFLSNHYHFLAKSPEDPTTLKSLIAEFHQKLSHIINCMDNTTGRKVWFQYWDKHITYHKSYLARLNYIMQNPVHHRLVLNASDYVWCSAEWFEKKSEQSFKHTVQSFKIDKLNEYDDF